MECRYSVIDLASLQCIVMLAQQEGLELPDFYKNVVLPTMPPIPLPQHTVIDFSSLHDAFKHWNQLREEREQKSEETRKDLMQQSDISPKQPELVAASPEVGAAVGNTTPIDDDDFEVIHQIYHTMM